MTTVGPQHYAHFLPFFLADGRRFVFTAGGAPDAQGVYLGSLDGNAPTRLTPDASQAVYLPAWPGDASGGDGWLLWARASTLVAQRLDLDRQMLAGDPVTLADGMAAVAGPFPGGLVRGGSGAGGVPNRREPPAATDVVGPVGHGAGDRRRPG